MEPCEECSATHDEMVKRFGRCGCECHAPEVVVESPFGWVDKS